jgi:hypothetical protein
VNTTHPTPRATAPSTHAELHDWRVVAVLSDSADEPPSLRVELGSAVSMVADRVVVGIVTARRSMISDVDGEVTAVEETLRHAGAFLAVLPPQGSEAEPHDPPRRVR